MTFGATTQYILMTFAVKVIVTGGSPMPSLHTIESKTVKPQRGRNAPSKKGNIMKKKVTIAVSEKLLHEVESLKILPFGKLSRSATISVLLKEALNYRKRMANDTDKPAFLGGE